MCPRPRRISGGAGLFSPIHQAIWSMDVRGVYARKSEVGKETRSLPLRPLGRFIDKGDTCLRLIVGSCHHNLRARSICQMRWKDAVKP